MRTLPRPDRPGTARARVELLGTRKDNECGSCEPCLDPIAVECVREEFGGLSEKLSENLSEPCLDPIGQAPLSENLSEPCLDPIGQAPLVRACGNEWRSEQGRRSSGVLLRSLCCSRGHRL